MLLVVVLWYGTNGERRAKGKVFTARLKPVETVFGFWVVGQPVTPIAQRSQNAHTMLTHAHQSLFVTNTKR